MILVLRWDISPGKRDEAKDFCHRNASFRKNQPGVEDTTVMMPLHGPVYRIYIVTRFSSLTSWDKWKKTHDANPEWRALMKEQREKAYFVPGTLERSLYEVV